jgi:AraC-like DNA-binding protein
LAELVHMSRSAFFDNFKDVMHASPLQYAKAVKLHKAQVLIQQGTKANEAAYLVGYNSPAQFSREYKRHFGFVPSATT